MLKSAIPVQEFSIGEARRIVSDLFEPDPRIYWTDFLLSCAVGAGCFLATRRIEMPWPVYGFLLVVCVLAYYRAALFIHELTHLRQSKFKGFRIAWNLLFGIPFCMPSFLHYVHVAHHARRHYGTDEDGEYVSFVYRPARHILFYLSQSLFLPLLGIIRFAIISPLTWFGPRLRDWVARRASSMTIDYHYVRPLPSVEERRLWKLQEIACFLILVGAFTLLVAGVLPCGFLVQAYGIAVGVITLNAMRTLAAHRYLLKGTDQVTFVDQLLDSVNVPHPAPIAGLWAPVGLRFHALHHLFPSMPYHHLAEAHRRLMVELPEGSAYRQVNCPNLRSVLEDLWRNSLATSGF